MKRQSGGQDKSERTGKKKAKAVTEGGATATATKQVAEEAVEESKEGAPAAAAAEMASLWSGVYEEMPWATSWIPFWEVDAYDVLYGDVLWDYDIWDFNTPKIWPLYTTNFFFFFFFALSIFVYL